MKIKTSLIVLMLILACVARGQSDFQVGNLNLPAPPTVKFLHTGQESYAYLIYPPDQGSCSLGGFELLNINMYLELTSAQLPVTFRASGGLAQAVWDPTMNQFVPGPLLCEGPYQEFHFIEPGLFVITVPMENVCGCQVFDGHYFLIIQYDDPFEADLPIDDLPLPGIVYNDKGAGWIDMNTYDKTAGGKVIIWGDIVCCEYTVGNELSTWSGIKSLYR